MPIQKKVEEAYTNLLQKYGNIITMRRKITKVWEYYYYEKKDYQTAYNISRAFVNQNGEYAWG